MPRHLKKYLRKWFLEPDEARPYRYSCISGDSRRQDISIPQDIGCVHTKIRNIKHSETKFPSLSDNCALSENHFFSRNPSKGSEPCDSQSSKLSKWQIVIEHINSNPNHSRYRLHLDMREYLSNLLGPESGFEKVCIIDDDAPNTRLQCRSAFHT